MAVKKKKPAQPPKRKYRKLMIFALLAVLLAGGGYAAMRSVVRSSNTAAEVAGVSSEVSSNPLSGKQLYVNPQSNAARQASSWRTTRPDDAKSMDRLAALPSSRWFGEQAAALDIQKYVLEAQQAGQMPVLVAYNIPNRDCGKYSAGGAKDMETYRAFIEVIRGAIAEAPAVIILEPDALAQMDAKRNNGQPCLAEADKEIYYQLMQYAVDRLKSLPSAIVYIDAGNSGWMPDAAAMAAKLTRAGVAKADGFSLNVSNFRATDETVVYGTEIAHQLADKHFVIDTSRNGLGHYENPYDPAYNWCNPPGRALGHYPTTNTGKELIDAYLHIKNAGESDGADPNPQRCFGGPKAGQWWPEYALGLVQRWPSALQPPVSNN